MDISALIAKLWASKTNPPAAPPARGRQRSVDPGLLRREGILSDPADPQCATKRARSFASQGKYREARALLQPHVDSTEPAIAAKVQELLAACAIAGIGGDWAAHCSRALDGYALTGDHHGSARVRQLLGEAMLAAGRLSMADAHLRQAAADFIVAGAPGRAAAAEAARARIPLRAGDIDGAVDALQNSMKALGVHQMSRAEADARLDLAVAYATKGDGTAATQEVLRAECLLSGSGNVADRVRTGMVRAETLLLCHENLRAALGLKHLLTRIRDVQEVPVRARLFYLLGSATAESEPEVAAGYFIQSRQLYDRLRHDYWTVGCDIALTRLEARLGQDPKPRLYHLTHRSFGEAPVLQNELRLLTAQVGAARRPEWVVRDLLQVRQYAVTHGHQNLLDRAEDQLRECGPELEEPTVAASGDREGSGTEIDFRTPFFPPSSQPPELPSTARAS